MNTEVETKKKKAVIAILAFLTALYLVVRQKKQNDLYYGDEEYDGYGNSTRKNYTFLLLVVCLFQLGMQMRNHKGVSATVSDMIQHTIRKRNIGL
ncbi:hypothetical protein [Bacillus pseudomycoides]|uniref:hypothetical protein n=1 Tax=Bacillus pseudomycoides TaxID=64104 RepID=UPI000BEC2F6E|nr:hypothetical protein [Bacillus pseudomycoides]PED07213.1 hypothetical protein COO19_16560 [Bacillus pseudomycoides]PEK11478.1 hypothetical protein CN693_26200 [Bacillus pseudomycoides]PEO21569.1 hypothetical protein CN542_10360 [Bacillus pseudomycoides]PEP68284.1 hypothetical protein CN591_09115 [Bacillus pseudomycoides]PFW69204.1 hypothetical protein COL25_08940 [Bacillus pseudomycoides]